MCIDEEAWLCFIGLEDSLVGSKGINKQLDISFNSVFVV